MRAGSQNPLFFGLKISSYAAYCHIKNDKSREFISKLKILASL